MRHCKSKTYFMASNGKSNAQFHVWFAFSEAKKTTQVPSSEHFFTYFFFTVNLLTTALFYVLDHLIFLPNSLYRNMEYNFFYFLAFVSFLILSPDQIVDTDVKNCKKIY